MTGVIITMPDGTVLDLAGNLTATVITLPQPSPGYPMDFSADMGAFQADHTMNSQDDWDALWAAGFEQGVTKVFCLEQSTGVTARQFTIRADSQLGRNCMELFMPKGSFGMEHRSCQVWLGQPKGPVNIAFKWCCPGPSGGVNLWTAGGGKWGPAIQYGPIQSGATGGIRFMPIWAAGASTLGKQDLTVAIQDQPEGKQWLQPPYYGFRPIAYDHWYDIHLRMTGGSESDPMTVRCEYWKDQDPVLDYRAATTNLNAQAGEALVFIDWTAFFGGGSSNAAPADARFRFADFRIWVEP
jgi:hypothetical protein